MKNSNEDVIDFIKNRKTSNVTRLYIDRNLRKEYLTYMVWATKRLKTFLKLF